MPVSILKSARWLALASASIAAPSFAYLPPPVSVPVAVVSDDPEAQAVGEAVVTLLREQNWFARDAVAIDRSSVYECVRKAEGREACIRATQAWKGNGAAVIILASGTTEQQWQCIGIAEAPKGAERQSVRIETQKAFFGEPAERTAARGKAAGCIMAAGAESGW